MQRMPSRPWRASSPRAARDSRSKAWQYISASRFDAPITDVGFTALSVEMNTIAVVPTARAASAVRGVATSRPG